MARYPTDLKAQIEAAGLLRALLLAEASDADFEEAWCGLARRDRLLREMSDLLFMGFDVGQPGFDRTHPEVKRELGRYAAFLESDLPYVHGHFTPGYEALRFVLMPGTLFTWHWVEWGMGWRHWERPGWPFADEAEYERTTATTAGAG